MRETGPRKRDEEGDEYGDVDEDDHRGDDSPGGTLATPRERERGRQSPLLLPPPWPPPRWGGVLPPVLGLHGDDASPPVSSSMASGDDGSLRQGTEEGLD